MEEIWQQKSWPYLNWNNKEVAYLLGEVRHKQGRLVGKICLLGIDLKKESLLNAISNEIIFSAKLDHILLDDGLVKTSVARLLKIKQPVDSPPDAKTEHFVENILDPILNYRASLTEDRIANWRNHLNFMSDDFNFEVNYRSENFELSKMNDSEHFLKNSLNVSDEMRRFLQWINTTHPIDPVIKAGVSFLRLLLIRPFDSGNGMIARSITNLFLSRADESYERIYSISEEIYNQKESYDRILNNRIHSDLDITEWLIWFLSCLETALIRAENSLTAVLEKSKFWEKYRLMRLNDRQVKMINFLWGGNMENKLTSSYWAKENICSPDTALRDIQDLIDKKILRKKEAGGRSTSYELN